MHNLNPNAIDDGTDMTFFLDGQIVGTLLSADRNPSTPDGQPIYTYDSLLFSATSLPNGLHTVALQNGQDGGTPSLILLDYLVYST